MPQRERTLKKKKKNTLEQRGRNEKGRQEHPWEGAVLGSRGQAPRSPRPDAPYLQPGPRRRERGSRLRAASQPAGHCGGAATRDRGFEPAPRRAWAAVGEGPPAIASLSLRRCL